MRARTTIIGACLLFAGLLFCSKDNIAGNSSQDGNVRGRLAKADGSPAAGVTIRFFPVDNAPRQVAKILAQIDSVTTDSDGNFGIDLDSGTYNMLAATDTTAAYQDSITAGVDTAIVDTMKVPGSLRAKVQLQSTDDPRTVFVLVMGTNVWAGPDTAGDFSLANMAEGTYNVRILTTLDLYDPLDTAFSIRSAVADTLAMPIQLKYTGIPVPTGLIIQYDTLKQIVTLSWDKPTTGRTVASYTIYRKRADSTTTSILAGGVIDTVYRDSTGVQNKTYEYRIAVMDAQGTEGGKGTSEDVTILPKYELVRSMQLSGKNYYDITTGPDGKIILRNDLSTAVLDSALQVITAFNFPSAPYGNGYGIAIDDSERIWAADYSDGNKITVFDIDGSVVDSVVEPELKYVSLIRYKSSSKTMYVCVCSDPPVGDNWSIRTYDTQGQFISFFPNNAAPLTDYITDMAFNGNGDLVVLNHRDSLVTVYDSTGIVKRSYKARTQLYSIDVLPNNRYLVSQVGQRGLIHVLDEDFVLNSILNDSASVSSRFCVDSHGRMVFRVDNTITIYK